MRNSALIVAGSPLPAAAARRPAWLVRPTRLAPGLALTAALGVVAWLLQLVETRWLGHPVLEGIVLSIVLGMVVRAAWTPSMRWQPGVQFAAKELLEVAIVALGATVSLPMLLRAGPVLLGGIVVTVAAGIVCGTLIGRALGLETRHALLIACGNAICGNSAIAAIAPVIGAKRDHVASAIAFTAVLGIAVILGLPLLIPVLHLSYYQYGVLAGMTVYAVPQVLAAAFPVSQISGEVGTLVKLVRVLLLGPVVFVLALLVRRRARRDGAEAAVGGVASWIPWFVAGFLLLAVARSVGLLGDPIATPMRTLSQWLTLLAMAALGLGADVRVLRRVGLKVVITVSGSLAVLVLMSATIVRVFVRG